MSSKVHINKCFFIADYKEICQQHHLYFSIGQKPNLIINYLNQKLARNFLNNN